MVLMWFATIFTPQGDGNPKQSELIDEKNVIRHDIYPARGRKLDILFRHADSLHLYSPRYLPRKGTETVMIWIWIERLDNYSPRYLPRKGTETSYWFWGDRCTCTRFATIFTPQGDGNEHNANHIEELQEKFATIFTPQGDGNILSLFL